MQAKKLSGCRVRLALLTAGLVASGAVSVAAAPQEPSQARRPASRAPQAPVKTIASLTAPTRLARETVLVQGGGARALILHPDSDAGRAAAAALSAAVQERAGVALPCRPGTAADREPGQNVFLLGHVGNNPAFLPLYGRFLTLADSVCPGAGGALLQTVFDPFGKGADVLVVGASDDAGLEKAAGLAAAAIRGQPAGADLALPRLFVAQYSAAFLKGYPAAGEPPKDSRVEEGLKEAQKAIDEGAHCSVARVLEQAGRRYLMNGSRTEAKLFVALWDVYARSAVADPKKYGGAWGFDSDFCAARVVASWDVVEHDPSLTDDERLRVARHMGRWLSEAVIPKCAGAVKSAKVLFNHQTFPALGALFAGLYYAKGYDTEEGGKWLSMADAIFRRQSSYFKTHEDCNGYQWLTHGHLMRYVVARPDLTVIENGNARKVVDFCIDNMNNLGYQVPYGDTGNWRCTAAEMDYLSAFAFLTGNQDAGWALAFKQRAMRRPPLTGLSAFGATNAAARPARFDGVRVSPLDPHYYASFPAAPRPPLARCFDKISFREALDPQAAYLLLDGLNNGGHSHRDGNSLTQVTQYNRIWLADNDYFKAAVKYHNSLLVFKDGASESIPDYCELLGAGETPRYGYSRTRLAAYAGVDWDRTVVWLKELQAFAALDRIVAREKGRYQLRLLWHGVGGCQLSDDGLLLTQKGPSIRIQLAPGPALALKNDEELGAENWARYPYAAPVVRSLSAAATVDLKAGEPYLFATVFHGSPARAPASWTLSPLARAGGVLVQTDAGQQIGLALGPVSGWPAGAALQSDAQVIVTDAAGLTLLGSTRAAAGETELQSASAPACVELARPAEAFSPRALPLETRKTGGGAAGSEAPAHRVSWDLDLAAAHPPPEGGTAKALHITRLALGRLAAGAARPDILVATQEGALVALKPDGSRLWGVDLKTRLNDVTAADLDRDGRDEIVVARQDGQVTVLNAEGKERWQRKLEFYRKPPCVNLVRTGDLDGDGVPEVIVGGENWRFYAYKADGAPLWNYESVHPSRSSAVADLDGDGKAEVVCGTHYYWLTAVSGDGSKLWTHKHGPIAYATATGSFDGNKTRRVILGSGDGCVYDLGADGKVRMKYDTGDEVRQVLAADVEGDGRDEILAGSLSHSVYCFGADDKRRWAADLGAGLSALAATVPVAGGGGIWAGTLSGRVFTLDAGGSVLAATARGGGVVDLLADGPAMLVATEDGRLCRLTAPDK